MSLKVTTRIPYGNARSVRVGTDADGVPEVTFAAAPHGGPEALWFCFNLLETKPEEKHPAKVRLTLTNTRNLLGCGTPAELKPVYQPQGHQWFRTKSGTVTYAPDGQTLVSWTIPYPEPATDVALCYPYGRSELDTLVNKSKGHWKCDAIGLSQGGREIQRMANSYGKAGDNKPGLYLIARQHAGETPGSWVLDGVLEHFSKAKKNPYLIWSVPLSDIDGVMKGDYGKDNFPYDLNRAWGAPPMRHEVAVIQADMREWQRRCQPKLVLDFHAPGGCESDGMYCFIPDPEQHAEAHREVNTWANVFADALAPQYATEDFARVATYRSRWETDRVSDFAREVIGCPALSFETPYASCGKTLMQQKQYRDAGRLIADAILRRHR